MISQVNGGPIVFECDHCGDELDTKTRDPDKAVIIFAEQEGWRVVVTPPGALTPRPDEHYCPTCPMQRAIVR